MVTTMVRSRNTFKETWYVQAGEESAPWCITCFPVSKRRLSRKCSQSLHSSVCLQDKYWIQRSSEKEKCFPSLWNTLPERLCHLHSPCFQDLAGWNPEEPDLKIYIGLSSRLDYRRPAIPFNQNYSLMLLSAAETSRCCSSPCFFS